MNDQAKKELANFHARQIFQAFDTFGITLPGNTRDRLLTGIARTLFTEMSYNPHARDYFSELKIAMVQESHAKPAEQASSIVGVNEVETCLFVFVKTQLEKGRSLHELKELYFSGRAREELFAQFSQEEIISGAHSSVEEFAAISGGYITVKDFLETQ